MEARQYLLAQVVVVTQRTPAPAYNAVAVSRDHAGLQQGGQLARPHRFTTATAGSSICATLDVAGIFTIPLSRPGLHRHTEPHLSA